MPAKLKKGDIIVTEGPLTITEGKIEVTFPPELELVKGKHGVHRFVRRIPRAEVDKQVESVDTLGLQDNCFSSDS